MKTHFGQQEKKASVEKKPTIEDIYENIILSERSKGEITKDLVTKLPQLKAGTSKAGAIRLQPAQKGASVGEDQFEAAVKRMGMVFIKSVPPGSPDSKSSKYNTYIIKDRAGVVYFIVIGGGSASNKGMNYERQLFDEVSQALKTKQPHQFIDAFVSFAKCPPIVDVVTGFNKRVQRTLTGIPQDVGEIIADITLVYKKGGKHYISLKEKNGVTIANNGIGNAFSEAGGKVTFNGDQRINNLLKAVKVNTDLACRGLEAFISQTPFAKQDISTQGFDKNVVLNYLSSAIDFGYFYVRNLGNGQFEMQDITTLEKLKSFIGVPVSVTVKYPYFANPGMQGKRKHISIEINTDQHVFNFDIRNASGGILPKQINLVKRS